MKRVVCGLGFAFLTGICCKESLAQDRCGTMSLLNIAIKKDPATASRLSAQEAQLQQRLAAKKVEVEGGTTSDTLLIPVVFHIVLIDPSLVTDAQIQAQVDVLNKDYAGLNSDSVKIPAYFKALFGHSTIRFALAKRTPDNQSTKGIVRRATASASFSINDDAVKSYSAGGDDPWNTGNYLNVWLCPLSGGLLGYSTIPAVTSMVPGVVVDYRSVPGGVYTQYNAGKTMTHEIGHFFNLYHIWGDDFGACTGTDYVDDTPNQGNNTSGSPTGVVTDACSPVSPGILYQDYMDYTDDDAMEMFTVQQVARMQAAAKLFRASLLISPGATALVVEQDDAAMRVIDSPGTRLCASDFQPTVTIVNKGLDKLTKLTISAQLDGGIPVTVFWRGNVVTTDSFYLSLPTLTATPGDHLLTVYSSSPNGVADGAPYNDTLRLDLTYTEAVATPLTEGFEGEVYPPAGWDLVNTDKGSSWEKVSGAAHTGTNSVVIRNFDDVNIGSRDYLRLPQLILDNVGGGLGRADSAFLRFELAAGEAAASGIQFSMDTLEVLASTDCGASYTSLYRKWGSFLTTTDRSFTGAYVPLDGEWRKDSIDISQFIGQGPVLLAFRNTNGHVNNIYLDDINVYNKTINPNLKRLGILVTPNPTHGLVNVELYPASARLKGISVYTMAGSLVKQVQGGSGASYTLDLSNMAAGIYIVKVMLNDRVEVVRILKE
jgi:hypothetical protein